MGSAGVVWEARRCRHMAKASRQDGWLYRCALSLSIKHAAQRSLEAVASGLHLARRSQSQASRVAQLVDARVHGIQRGRAAAAASQRPSFLSRLFSISPHSSRPVNDTIWTARQSCTMRRRAKEKPLWQRHRLRAPSWQHGQTIPAHCGPASP